MTTNTQPPILYSLSEEWFKNATKFPTFDNQASRNYSQKFYPGLKDLIKVTQIFLKLITMIYKWFRNNNLRHDLNNYHLGSCFPSGKYSSPPGSNPVHKKCWHTILLTKNGNTGFTNLQKFLPVPLANQQTAPDHDESPRINDVAASSDVISWGSPRRKIVPTKCDGYL